MKTTILIIFLISTKIICGQNTDTKIDKKTCIKIAPLALLDIYSGMSPRIGIEYNLKRSFYLYNEIGTYISGPNSLLNNKGFLTKIELKKYFNFDEINSGTYLSAELFFKHQSFGRTDSIRLINKYEKDYVVTKNVTCFTIKFGYLKDLKYNFFIDYFIGAGLRYKISSSTLTAEENSNIIGEGDYNFNIAVGESGKFYRPNIDIGLKIGYRIK
jgi:hypothetical protein